MSTNIGEESGDLGESGNVVAHFLKPNLGKGHSVYLDNNACGTVRKNSKGMPILKEKIKKEKWNFAPPIRY